MVNKKILLGVTVIAMLTLSAGVAWADEVTSMINYQGRLADSSGSPLSGTYTMTFRLYEAATGGTALDTDTHSVEVTNGLFNTEIDFDQSYFDGSALWLGIKVGADSEMTPRQEFRPVLYALSLVPGAVIDGSLSGPVLKVNTDGANSYGVYAYTTGYDSEGFYAYTTGEDSEGFYAETFGDYSEGVNARTAGNGSEGVYAKTTGKDSPAVYGWSEQDVGVYGKGKEGGYFTTTMAGSRTTAGFYPLAGVNVSTAYYYNPGVNVYTSGEYSDGVIAETLGDSSTGVRVITSGDSSEGVRVITSGEYGGGFYAVTDGNISTGVTVDAYGRDSRGVFVETSGDSSDGVYVKTRGDSSRGVYAKTSGDDSKGVWVETNGDGSTGIYATTSGDDSDGLFVIASGDGSDGVHASGKGYGVYAQGEKAGIYARSWGIGEYAAEFDGNVIIRTGRTITPVLEITGGSDLSEQFEIRGIEAEVSPSPGMVVSIDPEHPGELVVSNNAYDWRVAGIISGAGGLNPGMLMGQKGSEADGGYPVALSGRVYCWADASNGPIEPGDLLTTSETPGHAMKVTDHDRAHGAIIGKAMTGLEEGEGLVLALVALQ